MSETASLSEGSRRLLSVVPTEVLHDDVPGVLEAMAGIEPELAGAGLSHVTEFNRVYRTLTGAVWEAVREGEFSEPESVVHTVPEFADLYWRQIHAHAMGDRAGVDPAWQQLLYDESPNTRLPGTQFLVGMNAHIRADLPWALNASGVGPSYYPDYRRSIGMLIHRTAQQLSADYVPVPGVPRRAVIAITTLAIARWREQAWRDGQMLQGASAAGDQETIQKIQERLTHRSLQSGQLILGAGNLALGTLTHFAGGRHKNAEPLPDADPS